MMLLVTFLVGMAGVTTAYQRTTWWTPNSPVDLAHYNQIDFRYPDWVVSPRPPCLQEGVFPHPRSSNCTWYYRCTKAAFGPRFGTFYYECEPGTMFDDDLDQCVHPHSGYNCQAPTPPEIDVCSILPSSCGSYDSCPPARGRLNLCKQETCTISGVKNKCYGSLLWDVAAGRCVDPPNTCNCEYTATNCRQHDLCNPSGFKRLCDCSACQSGMMYDPSTKQCISKTALCPVLECVFRDSVCSCVNGQSLCTGCFLRGSLIPVSDFCKAQTNPYFYHVEKETCLYANAAYNRVATDGNCPRAGGNLPGSLRSDLPSLQCSLRNNNVIRCWSDDSY